MINPVVGSEPHTTSAKSTKATSTSGTFSTTAQSATMGVADAKAHSSSLSTGVKAGIAVGTTLAGLLFLLGVFFLWGRHNRSRQSEEHAEQPSELEGKRLTASYSGGELAAVNKPQELDSTSPAAWDAPKQKTPISETHLMLPVIDSLGKTSDASTEGSTFVSSKRVSEDLTPERLAQLEEEERIDEAIREI
jgi:hypothetical protein